MTNRKAPPRRTKEGQSLTFFTLKFVTLYVVAVQHVCVYGHINVMPLKILFVLQVAVISSATLCVPWG